MVKYKHNGICSFITFFSICVYFMSRSINSACPPRQLYPPSHIWRLVCWNTPSSSPPPRGLKVCSNAVSKCQIQWPSFFLKARSATRTLCRSFLVSHLLAEDKIIINSSKSYFNLRVLCKWTDDPRWWVQVTQDVHIATLQRLDLNRGAIKPKH